MALSITPSRHWLGNDGPWSTFDVRIGPSQKLVQVLPASSVSLTLAVLEVGCTPSEPPTCEALRGDVLHPLDLATWINITAENGQKYSNVTFPTEEFYFEQGVTSAIGVSSLGFADLNETLQGQLIAGYASKEPFLGFLGLSGREQFAANASTSYPSPLQTLKNNSAVSGLTWAYTAGAHYKKPESFGSLTFGGYDSSRVNMDEALTGVNFTRDFNGNELTLTVKSITAGDQTSNTTGLVAQLDSTVPDIWLPQSVYQLFEEKFDLQWNENFSMYLVSEEQRARLQSENTSVSFELAAPDSDPSRSVTITLPYSAFDHEVKFPLANITDDNTTLYYFPLKRLPDDTPGFQIFLGRTFFQEA
jgi:hypothetical protein